MGMSKSKSKSKPNKYAEPYITAAGKTLGPAYDEQQAVAKSMQPGLLAASQFYGDTIAGKYLDEGNPYLDRIVGTANRETADTVNSQFMPRFGSGYHAKTLADAIYANEARLRGGEYDRERGYQNEAAGRIGDLAGQATLLPGLASGQYANNAGGLFGRYMNTSTSTPWGPALLNGASNAAAAYFGGKRG